MTNIHSSHLGSEENYTKKIPFPPTTKQFLVVIAISAMVVGSFYAYNSPSEFEKCNQSFVNATKAIESYNKSYPNYKVGLPTYNCSQVSDSKKKV